MKTIDHEWKSANYLRREAQGWTADTTKAGVSRGVAYALEAVLEKHHAGDGENAVLEAVFPPDFADSPFVRFARQFEGDDAALSDVRRGLFLVYGGQTHDRRSWELRHRPVPRRAVLTDREAKGRRDRFDALLKRERSLEAEAKALQKSLGYPKYKDDSGWKSLKSEAARAKSDRLNPPETDSEREARLAYEREIAYWNANADRMFADRVALRTSRGWAILSETARSRGKRPFREFAS